VTDRYGAVAVLAALAGDALFADPARWHPVAGYGRAAGALERAAYRDRRAAGAGYVLVAVGAPGLAAAAARRATRRHPATASALFAAALWTAVGGTSLAREGTRMAGLLAAGDLPGARARLGHLCGRNPVGMSAAELARATVESVAENTSDAAVAPLLWAAVAGLPGVVAYRAANTLDAMVGHHTDRYERFGWAAARLDDVLNLVPARLTGVLACGLAPVVGGSPRRAWRALRRDGGAHPSPNAGRCEAAFAGALGVRLGGTSVYAGRAEVRGPLGDGPPPGVADIAGAVRLSRAVVAAAGLLVALRFLISGEPA